MSTRRAARVDAREFSPDVAPKDLMEGYEQLVPRRLQPLYSGSSGMHVGRGISLQKQPYEYVQVRTSSVCLPGGRRPLLQAAAGILRRAGDSICSETWPQLHSLLERKQTSAAPEGIGARVFD